MMLQRGSHSSPTLEHNFSQNTEDVFKVLGIDEILDNFSAIVKNF